MQLFERISYQGDLRAQLKKKKNHQKCHLALAQIPHSSQGKMLDHEKFRQHFGKPSVKVKVKFKAKVSPSSSTNSQGEMLNHEKVR